MLSTGDLWTIVVVIFTAIGSAVGAMAYVKDQTKKGVDDYMSALIARISALEESECIDKDEYDRNAEYLRREFTDLKTDIHAMTSRVDGILYRMSNGTGKPDGIN